MEVYSEYLVSNSTNRTDYEILIKKRRDNDFVAYCPQLNKLVKGESFENAYYSLDLAVLEHIKSIDPTIEFQEQISISDILGIDSIDVRTGRKSALTTSNSAKNPNDFENQAKQIQRNSTVPENIFVANSNEFLAEENDKNDVLKITNFEEEIQNDESENFIEIIENTELSEKNETDFAEKNIENSEEKNEEIEEKTNSKVNNFRKIELEKGEIISEKFVQNEEQKMNGETEKVDNNLEETNSEIKNKTDLGKNFVRKKLNNFRQYSEYEEI